MFFFSLHLFSYIQPKYIQRLKAIRATLQRSDFFQTHEVIGSSLLFVHDRTQASIWLIDFAKTVSLPSGANITHMSEWIVGNHEDGYLIGINNLIQIFEELITSETAPPHTDNKMHEANEADICGNSEMNDANAKPTDCTSENQHESTEMQTQENNLDLPQEIDAMKIDQTLQQSHSERMEDNSNQE